MVNGKFEKTQDMIDKLQQLKCETNLKNYQNISTFYEKMSTRRQSGNSQCEEDPFSKGAQCFGKNYHEVLILMKFLQD